ncbi:MAG TPA: pyroglutamyl-peptidase I [Burkholderiaceae bacterium]|nr:pyroglutamyl-peptidase I [Burkholderiaceae bacterium]
MVTSRRPRDYRATSQHRPTVLLTGFDPFDGESLNPSWLAVQALHGKHIAGHRVVAAQLPTVFGESLAALARLLRQHKPALVACIGQAGGRSALSLERVAINVNDARIADNASAQPVDTPVVPGGPAAYFTTLPIKAMRQAVQAEGIAAEVSQTAGTFVCNHVFYGLMHALATRRGFKRTRGGFIHVPLLPEQGTPCMPLEQIVRGLSVALRCALATETDVVQQAGAIS